MNLIKILVCTLVGAGFIFAQAEGTMAEEKKETKAQEKAEMQSAEKTLSGTVVSTDALINMIVIKAKKMEDTLTVEPGAKIMKGKEIIALGDLMPGVMVTLYWKMENQKKIVTKIVEKPVKKTKM
jgi:hypothetical protein